MRRLALIALVLSAAGAAATLWVNPSQGADRPYLIRAIFDDAAFAAQGEDVRVAGARVGSIRSLAVTADKRAAVTLEIDDPAFTPFHADASCTIRPQSLIGEQYVNCDPGRSSTPALRGIAGAAGAGSVLLPVTRTHSPIDFDIVQDISQQPVRESLAILIDELGTGLAARGSDLNAVIHRANPSLGDTDQVLQILARQNRTLARLAVDSDAVLTPLARARRQLSDFVVQANTTSVASSARARDIARTIRLLPTFLRQLRPLTTDLGTLANQGTPLVTELGQSASALGHEVSDLTPFAKAARSALIDLGGAAARAQPALVATLPLAQRLQKVGHVGAPAASSLDRLTASLNRTGGIEQLMRVLFYGTTAGNGLDGIGHYVRGEPLAGGCVGYAATSGGPACAANFKRNGAEWATTATAATASRATASTATASTATATPSDRSAAVRKSAASLKGLLSYLFGTGA